MAEITKKRRLSEDGSFEASKKTNLTQDQVPTETEGAQKEQRRSLFVRSLPTSVTSEKLAEYFSQSFPIKHATIVQDPSTKESKGYGFVTFADPEDTQQAIAEFNGSTLEGRKIKVELAQSRHREIVGEGGKSVPAAKALEQKAEREKQRSEIQPPKLIIRNLPWSIKDSDDLAQLFRSYGKVKSAVVPKKGPRAQSGFGFVILRGRKNAEKALQGVNGKEVDGRILAVDWAVDKKTWEELQKNEEKDEAETNGDEAAAGKEGEEEDDDDEEESDESGVALPEDDSAQEGSDVEMEDNEDDFEDIDEDVELPSGDEQEEDEEEEDDRNASTIFIRNLPFSTTDDDLYEQFTQFGPIRYARVVFDPETERSRGTGFVCFYNEESAKECVVNAPKQELEQPRTDGKSKSDVKTHSILQNEASDPSGKYTMEGRVLQITRALSKPAATRKEAEGTDRRNVRDRDKRRLYLLSEGTIPVGSPLYNKLGPTEISMRAASAKQRQNLIKSNPSLHLSLTRLSVRNLPRSVTSKDLKALAREAVVGFAVDIKKELRQPLSKEELARGSDEMRESERQRKLSGKGIVKQAKVVFESREGSKVNEKSGGGRSRGYGFIEYYNHRNALMGLRWLNGHAVESTGDAGKEEKKKRMIVEFAIENAQVVNRRKEIEEKAKSGELKQGRFAPAPGKGGRDGRPGRNRPEGEGRDGRPGRNRFERDGREGRDGRPGRNRSDRDGRDGRPGRNRPDRDGRDGRPGRNRFDRDDKFSNKRKRSDSSGPNNNNTSSSPFKRPKKTTSADESAVSSDDKNKIAKRNRIIAKKRMMRRTRKGGK